MIENLVGTKEIVHYTDNLPVRLHINDNAENYPTHWHTDIEIIMPLENVYTVTIDDTAYVLNPKDIILIPSGELHELYAPPVGKRIIMLFDNFVLSNLNGIDSIKNSFYPCLILRAEENTNHHQQLITIINQIIHEYKERTPFCEEYIYSMFLQLLVIVGRYCVQNNQSRLYNKNLKQNKYIDKLMNVCKYMNTHCTENITVEELATLAGFSKYHFIRLFHNFSGVSYYEYLIKRRIMYAETLLCNPNLSIVEIAMQSGFNSLSTFNRNFRSIKKCTPSEYRSLYNSQIYKDGAGAATQNP